MLLAEPYVHGWKDSRGALQPLEGVMSIAKRVQDGNEAYSRHISRLLQEGNAYIALQRQRAADLVAPPALG